jgi:alkylhydroperoxidase family enzyme
MKLFITLSLIIAASFTTSLAQEKDSLASLEALNQAAKQKLDARPNVPLADETADVCSGSDVLEAGRIPNYVRGLALLPEAAKPLAETFNTYIYGGSIAPETKMAMGLRVAQVYRSAYPAVHLQRLMRASDKGRRLLAQLQADDLSSMSASEQAAVRYAELLTRDIHGVSEAEFQKTRALFNDSQVVELTMTTCFFNYFLRYCEGANLPVEKWALDEPVAKIAEAKFEPPPARVALVSDDQMSAVVETLNAAKTPANNWNIGIANSQRAFMLAPGITRAWRAYTTTTRKYESVSREIKLHVSFAISMANGCRYCTLHQIDVRSAAARRRSREADGDGERRFRADRARTNCGRLRPQNHARAGQADEGRLRGAGRRIQRAGRAGSVAAELQFRLYEPLHRRVALAFGRRSDQNLSGDLRQKFRGIAQDKELADNLRLAQFIGNFQIQFLSGSAAGRK